jgi:hypothetical protein
VTEPVTTTVWTCRRCGVVEECAGTDQPKNWNRVYFASSPRSSEPQPCGYLCNPCGGYLITFVTGGDVAEAEAKDAELARMLAAAEAGETG